jgi:hypothetical protein
MSHESTVARVRQDIIDVFGQLDACFDRPANERGFRPAPGAWTIDETLEHVSLANHYLMLTWRKAVDTALRRVAQGEPGPEGESDLDRLLAIGERGSFRWLRPAHMTPCGQTSAGDLRAELRRQAAECLALLDRISHGEGALVRLHMSVNDLGRIDLYQWLDFLAQHARRHLRQIALIRAGFSSDADGHQ